VAEFEAEAKTSGALVLDVRKAQDFAVGHIPNAIFIGLDGQFAPWVGTVIRDLGTPILIVAPEGKEEETVMRLSRVGYDNCVGYLAGGYGAWVAAGKTTASIESITAEQFFERYQQGVKTLDVRKPGEFESSHLKNAESKPLDFIYDWLELVDHAAPVLIHCAGGYRSMIAASVMKAKGLTALTDVQGGFGAISKLPQVASAIVSETAKA
jgi:rhodanese-related sulfurtransferase